MATYLDRKWLHLAGSHLRNFKEKRTGVWVASCVYCGDSSTNPLKARMYVFEGDRGLVIHCHNCGVTKSFGSFLKHLDPLKYREYNLERFVNGTHSRVNTTTQPLDLVVTTAPQDRQYGHCWRLDVLAQDHPAVLYVEGRRIPFERQNELWYTPDFKQFMDANWPEHGRSIPEEDVRLVWFLTDLRGNVTHVCGRTLTDSSLRYIKIKIVAEASVKLFGLASVSLKEPVYIVEGELDSTFLPNTVASGDSSLLILANALAEQNVASVVCWDCEPRNKEIARQMRQAIDANVSCVIWPSGAKGKDINEMVLAGELPVHIMQTIRANTFRGAEALLRFNQWRRA